MATNCPHCACTSPGGERAHVVLVLLTQDDLDAALAHGLLDRVSCSVCDPRCDALLAAAYDARLTALAARERHRARASRLRRRKADREAARVPKAPPTQATVLPPAAADVLARALAKAHAKTRTPQ